MFDASSTAAENSSTNVKDRNRYCATREQFWDFFNAISYFPLNFSATGLKDHVVEWWGEFSNDRLFLMHTAPQPTKSFHKQSSHKMQKICLMVGKIVCRHASFSPVNLFSLKSSTRKFISWSKRPTADPTPILDRLLSGSNTSSLKAIEEAELHSSPAMNTKLNDYFLAVLNSWGASSVPATFASDGASSLN